MIPWLILAGMKFNVEGFKEFKEFNAEGILKLSLFAWGS